MPRIYNPDGSYYESMTPPTYPMRPLNGGPFDAPANFARYCPQPPPGECHMRVDLWRFEPKFNGWRALVMPQARQMFNRHGAPLSITAEFSSAVDVLMRHHAAALWDVEALERRHGIGKGSLVVLDKVRAEFSYAERRRSLAGEPFDWQETPFNMKSGVAYTAPSFDHAEACKFWDTAPVINEMLGCVFYEGLVAKRIDSPYNVQLRSDSEESACWIKHRFTTL